MASGLILAESPTLRMGLLLGVAIWCFARFYYFAFYVLEKYIDGDYRYAGLYSAMCFAIAQFRRPPGNERHDR